METYDPVGGRSYGTLKVRSRYFAGSYSSVMLGDDMLKVHLVRGILRAGMGRFILYVEI